jgi:hypothetical protein
VKVRHRRYEVRYDLAYDSGGSRWTGRYRTLLGARIAKSWNLNVVSWGGLAALVDLLDQGPVRRRIQRRGRRRVLGLDKELVALHATCTFPKTDETLELEAQIFERWGFPESARVLRDAIGGEAVRWIP